MDLIEIRERFNKFELNNRLFELKDSKGNPTWDIIRPAVFFDIFDSYFSESSNTDDDITMNVPLIKRLSYHLKRLFTLIVYFACHWNKKNLVLLCSRNIKNGEYYDKIADSLMDSIDLNDSFIVETSIYCSSNNYKYGSSLPMIESLLRHLVVRKLKIGDVLDKLSAEFPDVKWRREIIEDTYKRFYAQYYFYKIIIKSKNIGKCFLVQNGYQNGLYLAAQESGVPVYEFQHGEITKNHIVYSYPSLLTSSSNIYKPTAIFTFGDFWLKDCNYPGVNKVSLGNDSYHINRDPSKEDHSKNILVVSDMLYGKYLEPLVKRAVKANNLNDIIYYFKLHPNQENEYNDYVEKFKEYSCVEVVRSTEMISDYLAKVAFILAVESTVEFEALSSGVKVMIYKRGYYQYVDCLFKEDGVYLIDKETDLIDVYRNHLNDQIKDYGNYFFKGFDKELLKKYL